MKRTRREMFAPMVAAAAVLGGFGKAAADSKSQLPEAAMDGFRSGPLGPSEAIQRVPSERPVAMIIPEADVDAEVEVNHIVDGRMLNPTGPWVISWYEGTGMMHEKRRNMLFSGHVDYWGVGPAVLWTIASVPLGTPIEVLGEDGSETTYEIEYIERVTLAEMTAEKMRDITAPTPYEALTIITCGGEFDYAAGEYLQRDIIRARLIEETVVPVEEETEAPVDESQGESDEEGVEQTESTGETGEVTAVVTTNSLNVRPDPSTSNAPVVKVNAGDVVTIIGDPVDAEGYIWYPIRLQNGTEGFVVGDFLDIP